MMIDKVKFRRMVAPGDKLDYEVKILKLSGRICKFATTASVNGELAAEAELTAMMDVK
jgi:3-hydroxyacyl-[acyl-carrier-protein] dehydratase